MNNFNKNWKKILRLEEKISVKRMWDIEELGLILEIEFSSNEAICPRCGNKSRSLHQNYYSFVRDLPICGQNLWLRVNRRQFKCKHCKKQFVEPLNLVEKNKQSTKKMAFYIVEQVLLSGNIT